MLCITHDAIEMTRSKVKVMMLDKARVVSNTDKSIVMAIAVLGGIITAILIAVLF